MGIADGLKGGDGAYNPFGPSRKALFPPNPAPESPKAGSHRGQGGVKDIELFPPGFGTAKAIAVSTVS